MELKTIKLAGFKSFADPTTLVLKSQLTAVVGPNGCGKSNIIDAVRCVLSGAARHLRGDTLSDVVFNGSTSRKPVGRASVELNFDNSDGAIGGEYAKYPEISVRREIDREGASEYFLNGAHCRRKDIVDIFLGTGLGPQSYAIIEQGMISRIIESKPEELRVYLEEAAGISRYRERRRETENRLQHTRENLERLNDHRLELEKQLNHLQKQAQAAEKYKEYKQEERLLKAQLQAMYCRELQEQLQQQQIEIHQKETHFEAQVAELRQTDAGIEHLRQEKIAAADNVNTIQARFYAENTEISRLEQTVQNLQERRSQLSADLQQLSTSSQEIQQNHDQDQMQIEELSREIEQLEPELEQARAAVTQTQAQLTQAEQAMQTWQNHWDSFNQSIHQVMQTIQVEQTHQHHLQQTLQAATERSQRIQQERAQWDLAALEVELKQLHEQLLIHQSQQTEQQNRLDELDRLWQAQRVIENQITATLDQERRALQQTAGRHASLEALQQAALGKNDQSTQQWLGQQQLQQKVRLAENLRVNEGWELAVETVLGSYLEAVCVDKYSDFIPALQQFQEGQMILLQENTQEPLQKIENQATLAAQVETYLPVKAMLQHVYTADDVSQALAMITQLTETDSVITRDGLWLGPHWVRVNKPVDSKAGIIARERELRTLAGLMTAHQEKITTQEEQLIETQTLLQQLQSERDQLQQAMRVLAADANKTEAAQQAKLQQIDQIKQREIVLSEELTTNEKQENETQQQLAQATTNLQQAQQQLQTAEQEKQSLEQQRDAYRADLEQARQETHRNKTQADELRVRLESSRSQLHFIQQAIVRAEKQLQDMQQRSDRLQQSYAELENPLATGKEKLASALENRLRIEKELDAARQQLNHLERDLQQQEKLRREIDEGISTLRNTLEQMRLQIQGLQIRQTNHEEKITELDFILEKLLEELPAEADIAAWEEKLNKIENRIQRLGAINLAAIEEYQTLAERKSYLDAQNNDLLEAIATLEEAVRKIDQESRSRLKETYDKVNAEFNRLFQQVFRGGQAELELTENDFLTAGIVVKAQPPGKRNTTIHLLSGGEKALTAISLVFALFQLNPAPFCILDEVDAPLDDLNVGRFCNLVKEMSQKVQFIFISHNKITIELADQLIGVTMNEPGVSRLVSVDVSEAIALATA